MILFSPLLNGSDQFSLIMLSFIQFAKVCGLVYVMDFNLHCFQGECFSVCREFIYNSAVKALHKVVINYDQGVY